MNPAVPSPAALRRRRAALAQRLLAQTGPVADGRLLATLDWAQLEQAPDWLAWDDAALSLLQCRTGALASARELRLWIDAALIGAARQVVGLPYLNRLLALPAAETPAEVPAVVVAVRQPGQVAPALRAAGAAVLLAALPGSDQRRVIRQGWTPVRPAPLAQAQAIALVERALALDPLRPEAADPALAQIPFEPQPSEETEPEPTT